MTFKTPRANAQLRADILDLSRQNQLGALTPFFAAQLDEQIIRGRYLPVHSIQFVADSLVHRLINYRVETGVDTVVLGMSGGVDSAVVAALFKRADYRVIGVTMPIHQVQAETDRGIEACEALGLEHLHADLTAVYDLTIASFGAIIDASTIALTGDGSAHAANVRRGNIRARARMQFLYGLAHEVGGFVASTDNFSELVAGFWTLHGDVGDVAPIQSLLKSWEVPAMARLLGVPESTWRATPTDGLGISPGDEAQLGATYLEWDLMVLAIHDVIDDQSTPSSDFFLRKSLLSQHGDRHAEEVYEAVTRRIGGSWHKRKNPLNFDHPLVRRLGVIDDIDLKLFVPPSAR